MIRGEEIGGNSYLCIEMEQEHIFFMKEALKEARNNMESNHGGPFGAIVVKDGKIIARGANHVLVTNDPTNHAEIVAIREACRVLNTFQLTGCTIYSSCEPCPMCLGAIYWSRAERIFFAATRDDAATAGFDDKHIYDEYHRDIDHRQIPAVQLLQEEAQIIFKRWIELDNGITY